MGFSAVHKVRAAACDALEAALLDDYTSRELGPAPSRERIEHDLAQGAAVLAAGGESETAPTPAVVCAVVATPQAAMAAKGAGADRVYAPVDVLRSRYFAALDDPRISGIASNLLTIEGVDSLHGTDHLILPDMIEVGSFIGMAAMCGNGVRIKDVSVENLGIIPDAFRRLGVEIEVEGDDLWIPRQDHYEIQSFMDGTIMTLADAPWPGLTPDLLSVLIVVATQARGSVLFHQKMFESRLFFVDKLIDMGAQIIICDPHRAVVVGHDRKITLRGGRMSSPDIRAGIALLIAAMSAKGTSRIDNIEQIDRGYENIEARLNALGANIVRG